MTSLRLTLTLTVVTTLTIALYLSFVLPGLRQAEIAPAAEVAVKSRQTAVQSDPTRSESASAATNTGQTAIQPAGASRKIEIYGRVEDATGHPIEGVLITEERYFFTTSTDSDGQYRLALELPPQRRPTLHFLRAGFGGERVMPKLTTHPEQRLDMVLSDDSETLRISGRVGNDLGVSLEGVRIEISALETSTERNYYLTVFSDARGEFVLEGVRANTRYKLTAVLAPEYPLYLDADLQVGIEAPQLDIVMKTLKFVTLRGMLMNPEAAPVSNFELYIKNISTGIHTRRIVSDSSGYFSLSQFPLGEVSLTTRGPDFHKISGVMLTEENYANLVLLVDRGDRHLSGWVSDENGVALEKVMVTLEATLSDDGVEYSSYRSQTTDSSGRFSFSNIAAGEHRISAYANGFARLAVEHRLRNPSAELNLRLTRSP